MSGSGVRSYIPDCEGGKGREKADGPNCRVYGGDSGYSCSGGSSQTAEYFGCRVDRIYDVESADSIAAGQAGGYTAGQLCDCRSGMEGALASVIGGLVDKPVIAVPTSIGYGQI